jgi:DNA-binding transcriptional ArsR family regulator
MEAISDQKIAIQLAPLLDALGNPARLQFLLHLAKTQCCPACKIVEKLPLAQSTVSVHMSKLKKAGLIKSAAEGNHQNYELSEQGLMHVKNIFNKFINEITVTLK